MCLAISSIRNLPRWNWEGDRIVHECIVPSSRPVIGYTKKKQSYDIDVREFLITTRNEVIGRTLSTEIKDYANKRKKGWEFFQTRENGSFDFRASVITDFVSKEIKYAYSGGPDPWQFPDETLHVKEGDCEDRALLIASLLIASGVSSYNVRVSLGKMRLWKSHSSYEDRDHVWCMYKNEVGHWRVIEPLCADNVIRRKRPSKHQFRPQAAEYIPYFIFNDNHLWQMFHPNNAKPLERVDLDRDWSQLHPSFAGEVHRDIIEEALNIQDCPESLRDTLRSYFSPAIIGIGPIVDTFDRDFSAYDPADHFDNGFIEEGWQKVSERLARFKQNPRDIKAFGAAAHGIADFYAHSSFTHFSAGSKICIPTDKTFGLDSPPIYGAGSSFDLTKEIFSVNGRLWKNSKTKGAEAWNGRIISGRYAQAGDSQSFLESLNRTVRGLKPQSGVLPHHAEIAVDGGGEAENVLYQGHVYQQQLQWRKMASIQHIREAFLRNYAPEDKAL